MEEAVEGVWVGQKQLLKVVEVVVERGMWRSWRPIARIGVPAVGESGAWWCCGAWRCFGSGTAWSASDWVSVIGGKCRWRRVVDSWSRDQFRVLPVIRIWLFVGG